MYEKQLENIQLIAFDLDNTLYDESKYFSYAFDIIIDSLYEEFNINKEEMKNSLWTILKLKGKHYHHLFDDFLQEYNLEVSKYLSIILELFKKVNTDLELFPGVRDLLIDLKNQFRLSLITNGMVDVQKNKVKLLNIENFFESIIFSATLEEDKPSVIPFEHLLKETGMNPENVAYVGDNPLTDFIGAKSLGIFTIRVPNTDFDSIPIKSEDNAEIQLNNILELKKLFQRKDS